MDTMSTTARRRKEKLPETPIQENKQETTTGVEKSSGYSKLTIVTSILLGIIVLVTAFGYKRSPINPEAVNFPRPVTFGKDLQYGSNRLERGERIINGLVGPESIVIDEHGNMYTGLLDGRIIKIHRSATGAMGEGLVEDIVTGTPANVEPVDGHIKPRPLGLRLHHETLYVADAYYGLYSVHLETRKITILVKPSDVRPSMKFPNDLDITKDGEYIYFTDTSYKWNLHKLYYDVLEGSCTGRFFRYSLKTGNIKLLANKLCFPNGVQLLDNEKTALVSETTRFRVLFVDTRKGNVSNFVIVPGYPDNIRKSDKDGYWVALPIARTKLKEFLASHPMLRKIVAGLMPTPWLRTISNTKMGTAIKLNENGDIIDSIHDTTGEVSNTVSEIVEMRDGTIFAGSYKEAYMVKCQH